MAGVAETDITPPIGFRMAGYFDERLSTGVHDPLKAKAIVLEQGGERVALVFCDLVGVSLDVSRAARERASQATGIPVTNIIVTATHSHTGPLFDDPREAFLHRDEIQELGRDPTEKIDYPSFLREQIVRVIVAANGKLQPAELDAGIGTLNGVAFNRRYYMKNGTVAFNPGLQNPNVIKPAGPTDPDVGILIVKNRATKKPVGGLTVFAMHADTTGGTLFSADYPYGIQQTLREKFGSNYVSAFGAGTCGDINHVDASLPPGTRISGLDKAQKIGRKIGDTVLAELPDLAPLSHPSLAVRSQTLMLPLQQPTQRELAEARAFMPRMRNNTVGFYTKVRAVKAIDLAERGKAWPSEVQVVRLDSDDAIVFLPGEIFVQFGLAIKAASPFKRTMVVSISNDRPGYVPTLKAFREGSYEVINSRLAPGGGEKMTDAAIKMLNALKLPEARLSTK